MSQKIYPLKLYLKDKPILVMFVISLLFNIATWIWLIINVHSYIGQVFLHYNILFGVDLVGEWYRVFYIPVISLLILFFNTILGWLLFHKDKVVSYLLHGVAVLVQILLLVVSAILVFLNI
ncbi:MAG: hypothetical protein COX81_04180 [Candidatus Magasanikbacteria bacterium CG_4_10_14_0_2_um_filter_37_12]|uniref:Uncharacterized protein n=1 Tax=Candidatus Magasanikbacteria bacterium CG_4_10_14_0_2_um_filter_37_12 TaxID=1974637 RepID=A0A2M7V6I3_9BACT|nr:MAG: hypothetical protein COX81_04180 [Candidatus Magasanikbacteria bacterium CG_4_10_14_0_2_um_filter_37_12]